ncbi:sugar transferase [Phycicoccus flavus]|uniref:sugar transferase n=1 Tax=Phycicoccus flavus TaxID=2502783 RepID=UPI000FEC1832|nr:sugar transferase [Phycicoccus flavus]NHA66687.1 sugar transferase [Phycicoccus flavus]
MRTEQGVGPSRYTRTGKRVVDVAVSLLALPVVAVVAVPVGIAIKREDGGPVLYRSRRVGLGMREFDMYKFRTMAVAAPDIRNADGSTFSSDTDPRVTRVGGLLRRTSLDELPQFLNVLLGDMSLVGPRPSPTGNRHLYPDHYLRKFDVRPGISGYNQYLLRNSATREQRFANDLFYVDHVSARLDATILLGTVRAVLRRENINR